jgi:lipoyl synthase
MADGPSVGAVTAYWLGTIGYEDACRLQEELAARRASGAVGDVLLFLEHPAVITVGQGGGEEDILASPSALRSWPVGTDGQAGIPVLPTDRGGRATYHGPGQLVVYPILKLAEAGVHGYVDRLEQVAERVVESYGLAAETLDGYPGVWINARKVAAVGVAVRDGVTRHGLSLNVAPDLAHFRLLVPCGIAGRGVTSIERELGRTPGRVDQVAQRFRQAFAEVFCCPVVEGDTACLPWTADSGRQDQVRRVCAGSGSEAAACPEPVMLSTVAEQPTWLWRPASADAEGAVERMDQLLSGLELHTVCREAHCPNLVECFVRGTATFLLLGSVCTRACRFCAVQPGWPAPPDPAEPERVAEAARRLGLSYVVLTSVTRDDLPDGGASAFAATVRAVRHALRVRVEVLIPDLRGSCAALETVLAAEPDVLNHNLETVPRLYPQVRPGARYERSLRLLARAKAQSPGLLTKSGLMLGLGERTSEVLDALAGLRRVRCDLLTLGQYLQPGERQRPVARYVPPDEFDAYRVKAEAMGFRGVAAGPLVRSSHQAAALWQQACFSYSGSQKKARAMMA